jgi:hypothetical protein
MRWPGLVGADYQSRAKTADQERLVNLILEKMESPGATSQKVLYRVPGLDTFGTATAVGGRALFAEAGRLFAIHGTSFEQIDTNGTVTVRGTVAIGSNPATISSNGDGGGQLLITSGNNAYCYTIASTTLTQIAALNGLATMGDYLDGYGLILDATTSKLYISSLLDFSTWATGTDFAQRSKAPDPWRSMKVNGLYINLYGEKTSEPWYDSGTSSFPFAPYPSALIPYGIAAAFSTAIGEGHAFRLAQSSIGQRYVTHSTGFSEEVVSDFPRQFVFDNYAVVSDAIGEVMNLDGHILYRITFPTADATWFYDLSTGVWAQWGTWSTESSNFSAHRARWHAVAFGEHIMLDANSGAIYSLNNSTSTDVDGVAIRCLRRAPALSSENELIFYAYVELLMELAVGAVTGQGEVPMVMMRRSDDYGETWSEEIWASMGKVGQYDARIRWDGEGSARGRVYEFSWTDPVFIGLVDGFMGLGQTVRSMQQRQSA